MRKYEQDSFQKCNDCEKWKTLDCFGKNKNLKNGLVGKCKICTSMRRKEWYQQNSSKAKAWRDEWYSKNVDRQRNKNLLKSYNIDQSEFEKMLSEQSGKCAICGFLQMNAKKTFSVDHNHETGKIRGILCNRCNQGLGYLKADSGTQLLTNAIKYIEKNER